MVKSKIQSRGGSLYLLSILESLPNKINPCKQKMKNTRRWAKDGEENNRGIFQEQKCISSIFSFTGINVYCISNQHLIASNKGSKKKEKKVIWYTNSSIYILCFSIFFFLTVDDRNEEEEWERGYWTHSWITEWDTGWSGSVDPVQYFLLVKVPVAAASGTHKCCSSSLTGTSHEFPATIHCVTSGVGCMILLTLSVSNIPHRRRCGVFSLHHHLPFFHLGKTLTAVWFRAPQSRKVSRESTEDPFSSWFHRKGRDSYRDRCVYIIL